MIMNANMNNLDRIGITFEASGLQFSLTVRLLACFLEFARLTTRTALYSNAFGYLITASAKFMALKLCISNVGHCSFSTLVGPRAAFLVSSLDGLLSITWADPLNTMLYQAIVDIFSPLKDGYSNFFEDLSKS